MASTFMTSILVKKGSVLVNKTVKPEFGLKVSEKSFDKILAICKLKINQGLTIIHK